MQTSRLLIQKAEGRYFDKVRCSLVDLPSPSTVFYLFPAYRHQDDRQSFAIFGEEVYITCNSELEKAHIRYLNFSNFELGEGNYSPSSNTIFGEDLHSNDIDNRHNEPVFEINLSSDERKQWVIHWYNHISRTESTDINYGEAIWIIHLELIAELIGIDTSSQRERAKTVSTKRSIVGVTEFQVHLHKSIQGIKSYAGLWIIERCQGYRGGRVTEDSQFRLKHYLTGSYLRTSRALTSSEQELTLSTSMDENTIFSFKQIKRGLSIEQKSIIHILT